MMRNIYQAFFASIAAVLIFKSITYIGAVENIIAKYPLYTLIGGFALFFFSGKIVEKLKLGGN